MVFSTGLCFIFDSRKRRKHQYPFDMAACSGLSSGALFVRLQGEKLSAEGGILDGAKPFLHDFLLAAPSIESQLAPWQQRVRSLRQRRSQTRVGPSVTRWLLKP